MNYSTFLQRISREPVLNPFHSSFTEKKFLESFVDLDERDSGRSKALMVFVILVRKEFEHYLCLTETVVSDSSNRLEFFLNAIEVVNHDSVVANQKVNSYYENSADFNILKQFGMTINAGGVEHDLGTLMDTTMDTFDFIRRKLKMAELQSATLRRKSEVGTGIQQRFMEFFLVSNFFQAMESLFQMVCFEGSEFAFREDGILLISPEFDLDLFKRISNVRIVNNISLNLQRILSNKVLKNSLFGKYFRGREFLNSVSISPVDGYITLTLCSQEAPDKLKARLVSYQSVYISYFYHLSKESLRRILEVAEVFTVLQNLSSEVMDFFSTQRGNDSASGSDPNYFQQKIRSPELYRLICGSTGFSHSQIREALAIFENDGCESCWDRPLLRFGNDYYLILHGLHNAHALNLFDYWCKTKKIEIDEKGPLFERYVKDQISAYCQGRRFDSKVSPHNKFRCPNGKEEIDLVWETKNTILIGEVKCLRYPFDSRKYFDFKKVVKIAAEQVKRKRDFLVQNKISFPGLDLSKQIAVCVITNYPTLTGAIILEVPVIDFAVLGQYIEMGYIASAVFESGNENEHVESMLYTNETEFSLGIPKMLMTIPILKKYKRSFKKSLRKIPFVSSLKITVEEYEYVETEADEADLRGVV